MGAANLTAADLKADGDITQTGDLVIGTASLSGTNITLANASNDFDTVTLSGAVVNLTDTDEVALATSTITSDFTLAAGGDVTQDTGASTLSVTGGVTSVTLTAGDITLDNAGNDFNEVTTTGATNVTLGDDNAIVLGQIPQLH